MDLNIIRSTVDTRMTKYETRKDNKIYRVYRMCRMRANHHDLE